MRRTQVIDLSLPIRGLRLVLKGRLATIFRMEEEMFLDNEYVTPLFDTVNGGPPKAFKCKCMNEHGYQCTHPDCTPCNKVVRTERGIRMHLKLKHGITEQTCLFSTDNETPLNQNVHPRNLRLASKQNIIATTKRSLTQDTEPAQDQPTVPLLPIEPATSEKK